MSMSAQSLRIIAGRWRSRRLSFPALPGLRPTPDRVRETLFNWLMPVIEGAHCLDLFAGSGALGLEALSRGAGAVTFVEQAPAAAAQLRQNLQLLQAPPSTWQVYQGSAERFVQQPAQAFDVIFLDPPFRQAWLPKLVPLLLAGGWLKPHGWLYMESENDLSLEFTQGYSLWRERQAGQVSYRLLQVAAIS